MASPNPQRPQVNPLELLELNQNTVCRRSIDAAFRVKSRQWKDNLELLRLLNESRLYLLQQFPQEYQSKEQFKAAHPGYDKDWYLKQYKAYLRESSDHSKGNSTATRKRNSFTWV